VTDAFGFLDVLVNTD